jgi:hypothetical protein
LEKQLRGGNASHFEKKIKDVQPMVGVRMSATYQNVKMGKPLTKTKK